MEFDDDAFGIAVRDAAAKAGCRRIGEVAAFLGVSEIEVSAVFRKHKPSQKLTEAAAARLGISYAGFAKQPAYDLDDAMDLVARESVLPFPYRHRVQDDV